MSFHRVSEANMPPQWGPNNNHFPKAGIHNNLLVRAIPKTFLQAINKAFKRRVKGQCGKNYQHVNLLKDLLPHPL